MTTLEEIKEWLLEYSGYTGSNKNLIIAPVTYIKWLIQRVKDLEAEKDRYRTLYDNQVYAGLSQTERVKDLEEEIKHQRWMLYGNKFKECSWIHPAGKGLYNILRKKKPP